MATQQPAGETTIRFDIMPDGEADMTFISKSIAGTLEYYRVCTTEIGTVGNAATTEDEVTVGKGIINCTMQAFALECALKGIYQALGRKFRHIHDLERLYEDLPRDTKQEIEESWKKWTIAPETAMMTFKEFVLDHNRDFEDWRYLQGKRLESAYFAYFAGTRAVNYVADKARGNQQA